MTTTASSALRQVAQRRLIDAALQNEQVTRDRVTALEKQTKVLESQIGNQQAVLIALRYWHDSTFWARLRWLFLGSGWHWNGRK